MHVTIRRYWILKFLGWNVFHTAHRRCSRNEGLKYLCKADIVIVMFPGIAQTFPLIITKKVVRVSFRSKKVHLRHWEQCLYLYLVRIHWIMCSHCCWYTVFEWWSLLGTFAQSKPVTKNNGSRSVTLSYCNMDSDEGSESPDLCSGSGSGYVENCKQPRKFKPQTRLLVSLPDMSIDKHEISCYEIASKTYHMFTYRS